MTLKKKLWISLLGACMAACVVLAVTLMLIPTTPVVAATVTKNTTVFNAASDTVYASQTLNTEDAKVKFTSDANATATGGYAAKISINRNGLNFSENAISFSESVDVASVNSLTIRMFIHLSAKSPWRIGNANPRFFAYDTSYSTAKAYDLANTTTQDEWIDVVIDKTKLSSMADSNGKINGLALRTYFTSSGIANNDYTENNDYAYDSSTSSYHIYGGLYNGVVNEAYILIDTITYQASGYEEDETAALDVTPDVEYQNTVLATFGSLSYGSTSSSGASGNSGYVVSDATASNGYVFRVNFHSAAVYRNSNSPLLTNPIKVSETGLVKIRIFCHLSPNGNAYYVSGGGIRLCSLTDTNGNDGNEYMIPTDVVQDQWTELTLTYSEFSKLADSDGYINGLQIASNLNGGEETDGNVYSATANETYTGSKSGMYILIDKITAVETSYGDNFTITSGASIRFGEENTSGIRFETAVSKQTNVELGARQFAGEIKSYHFGMIITKASYLTSVNEFTMQALDEAGKTYVGGEITEFGKSTDTDYYYAGTIQNVKATNFDAKFVARMYIKIVNNDDSVTYIYSTDCSDEKSISEVAEEALNDWSSTQDEKYTEYYETEGKYSPYDAEERAILQGYIG